MLGGQAAVWITLVTAEQRLARQWAERTQGTEPRREPPALDLEMPQNGTGRRGQGPLVKSVNGARDPLPLLTPGGSEGSLPPSLGATDVTNVFSFNSGGSRGKKKKKLILHFRGSPGIRSAAHPETNPTLASGVERDGFGAARPKLARQQICPLAANLQTLFGLCASVSLDAKRHNEGLALFRRLLGGDLCRGPRMVSGKRQMLRKCCFIIIFVDQSPSPTAHPLLHAQRLRQPGSEPRTPGERGEELPTAPAGCCCHLLVSPGTGPTRPPSGGQRCVSGDLQGQPAAGVLAARRPGGAVMGKQGELTGFFIDQGGLLVGWRDVRRARDGGGGAASPSGEITRVHARPHRHAHTCST